MSNERLYTEKEISKILKRAGEVQAAQSEKITVGLSLEEIQQIAKDVGLEPDIVANVANEIDDEPEQEETGFFSSLMMPTKIDLEHVLPGNLSENEWPEVVSLIERATGKSGSSSQIGKMLEWISDGKHTDYKLSLFSGEDQSKVILQGNFNQLALSWTLPILINVAVWAFLLAMLNLGLMGIPIGVAVTFVTYLVILRGFKNFMKKKRNSIKSVFRKMGALVSGEKTKPKSTAKDTAQSRIEIPEEEPGGNTQSSPIRNRVR